jgi:hypothetical protein
VLSLSAWDSARVRRPDQQVALQPWPKGIHKQIAIDLGTTPSHVQKAIKVLTQAGIFRNQLDGVVVSQEEFGRRQALKA